MDLLLASIDFESGLIYIEINFNLQRVILYVNVLWETILSACCMFFPSTPTWHDVPVLLVDPYDFGHQGTEDGLKDL